MSESYDKRGVPLPPVGRDPLGLDGVAARERAAQADTQTRTLMHDPARLRGETAMTERPGHAPHPGVSDASPTDDGYDADPATVRTEPPGRFAPDIGVPDPDTIPDTTPIVPAGSVTSRSLTLVIAIMCFFACLTAGTVYLINKSASGWLQNLASEVTVQIEPVENTNADATVAGAVAWLSSRPGIIAAQPISEAASRTLLEPWLGSSDALAELPIPRLIALQLDQSTPQDFDRLRADLTEQFPTATLDDHRQWQAQIKTVTRSFALGGLAILLLVGAATTAIIVSATRSAMLSNREIVEVLHFVGATDRFIAREFERNFLNLGIRAGLVGAAAAVLVFLAMPTIMEVLGGGTVTLAEIKRFIGSGSLDAIGLLWLCVVVVIVAALCMITSRLGVYRILNSRG